MTKQEKFIPGFGRYTINKKGVVKNELTQAVMTPDNSFSRSRVKLVDDAGKRQWFYPNDHIKEIFKTEEKVIDPFKSDTSKIEMPLIPETYEPKSKKYDFVAMDAESKRKIHASHKITTLDVISIRHLLDNKLKTKKEIGIQYGIASQTVGKIGHRKIYKNIPESKAIE